MYTSLKFQKILSGCGAWHRDDKTKTTKFMLRQNHELSMQPIYAHAIGVQSER